jgi:hypothetical protein
MRSRRWLYACAGVLFALASSAGFRPAGKRPRSRQTWRSRLLAHQASNFFSNGRLWQAIGESGIERSRILMSDGRNVCLAEAIPALHILHGR